MEYHQNILHDMPQGMFKGCLNNLESTLETFAKLRMLFYFGQKLMWLQTSVLYIRVCVCVCSMGFPSGSVVKNHLPLQETWVQSLGWEHPLEKEMQPTAVCWPGIPWTEGPSRLQSTESKKSWI